MADQLLICLGQEKEVFRSQHGNCSPDEFEKLWIQRKARIFATLDSDTPLPSSVSIPAAPLRSSATSQASLMARAASDHPMRRRKSTPNSKQPAGSNVPMVRNITLGSTMSVKRPNPSDTSVTTGMTIQHGAPSLDNGWRLQNEEPWNCLPPPSKMRRVEQQQNSVTLESYTPEQYVNQNTGEQGNVPIPFSKRTQIPNGTQPRGGLLSTARQSLAGASPLSLSPTDSPRTPLTDASTLSTGMSRDISLGSQVYQAMDNVHISSSSPDFGPSSALSSFNSQSRLDGSGPFDAKSFAANGSVFDYHFDLAHPNPVPSAAIPAAISFDEDIALTMDEEDLNSTEMAMDNTDPSAASRRRRSMEQLARSDRPLLPKNDEAILVKEESNNTVVPLRIETSMAENKEKIAITKLETPPQQVYKLKCNKCTKQPQGFRGPHELSRHYERDHSTERTVWVCVDKSPNGTMLGGCKHCKTDKKYGAYYNAAAHIRRHFKRAAGGRSGAGSSGGDWPPMDELKAHWIKEVKITVLPDYINSDAAPTSRASDRLAVPAASASDSELQPTVGTTLSDPHLDFSQDILLEDSIFQGIFAFDDLVTSQE